MSIRVLLADDHTLFREGLRALLNGKPDIEVVAEAENGRRALQLAREVKPDVVVMDITMPDLNGIEATHRLMTKFSGIKVIALSMHSDHQLVHGMMVAGASGYLLKDCAFEELERAIRTVVAGGIYLNPRIASTLIKHYVHDQSPAESSIFSVLSAREREVLQLIAEGKNTKQIACSLNVSHKTVEAHRKNIMTKLDIHSISELTKYAIREGLTGLEA